MAELKRSLGEEDQSIHATGGKRHQWYCKGGPPLGCQKKSGGSSGLMEYCLLPLPEEEQKQKGLYTDNGPNFLLDDDGEFKPPGIVFPFAKGRVDSSPRILNPDSFKPVIPLKTPVSIEEELRLFLSPGTDEKRQTTPKPLFLWKKSPPPPQTSTRPSPLDDILAAEGRCLTGPYLTPFCKCCKGDSCSRFDHTITALPDGALEEHRSHFAPIWLAYRLQTRQSHCFDIDDHPGSCFGSNLIEPLPPSRDFNNKAKLPMELANLAIQEYNVKNCNVPEYKVLKIEKTNFSVQGMSYQYWMTVKVLNLTLATPIETFQIHAGKRGNGDKVIYCSRPKEEVIVGLPSCNVCLGKLRVEEGPLDHELPEKFLVHLNLWDDDDFIPKGASKEHSESFRRIYGRYLRQIHLSDGFDFDIYPGDAKEAKYIPYLDFEKEADLLIELANHAIQDYNNKETSVYKYMVSYIEKVNFSLAKCREFYMTVKVINLTLRTTLETFQIHAFKGPHGENIVRRCRKKMLI